MNGFERLADLAKVLFTAETELRNLRAEHVELRAQIRHLNAELGDLRDRVVRLETHREADAARIEMEISRFKLEVERAEARLSRLPAGEAPKALPPSEG